MATYIIGDIQGCYYELQDLLTEINFDANKDRLGFVGDLVNRGPESLKALRFIKSLKDPIIILGNHDVYLLAIGYEAVEYEPHTMQDILAAPDKIELLDWLRQQKLIHREANFILTHAGIAPQWSIEQAFDYAHEVESALRGDHYFAFLQNIEGNEPKQWSAQLTGWERLRYITNAFTRMRFCSKTGELDLENKSTENTNPNLKPWFAWRNDNAEIIFGHWAALLGKADKTHIHAIDTGCAWGVRLTAFRLEDQQLFSVPSRQKRPV